MKLLFDQYFTAILFISCLCLLTVPILHSPAFLRSQELPPKPDRWVMDYAGVLDSGQQEKLNQKLRLYEDSTSNQIVVAIFQNAQGYPVEEFTIRLAETWKIGRESRDNGIILAIFLEERRIRIEVGYGLEDKVPDAVAIQIAQNIISPYFKEGEYFTGISEGLRALIQAASGKFKSQKTGNRDDKGIGIPFIFIFFILIFILSAFRRRRRATVGSGGWRSHGPIFWGGFGRGGSRSSGFGGGGFSAGGGSFGGGGATGSW